MVDDGRCNAIRAVEPLIVNNRGHGCAIIGGIVYRGAAMPWLHGAYLFSDFCKGYLWALTGDAESGFVRHEIAYLNRNVASLGMDHDGEVHVLAFHGPILKLVEYGE